MPDWDAESEQLRSNLIEVLRSLRDEAATRMPLSAESARQWHRRMLDGLELPDPIFSGRFRGEAGLEDCEVAVAGRMGARAVAVAAELGAFDQRMRASIAILDAAIPAPADLDTDRLAAVIDLCAWVHAEWVRIHPFANGNGRTARLWANAMAMRYGLPPFVRPRPRPDLGYGDACAAAMHGDWRSTAVVLRALLDEHLE